MQALKYSEDQFNFQMVTIPSKEVFRVGKFVDSKGTEAQWTYADLEKIVHNFNNDIPGTVPVKLGHTSPAFIEKVAKALDLPKEVLSGEGGSGKGGAALGYMKTLRVNGEALYADLEVPEKMAELVEDGLYHNVSMEVFMDYKKDGVSYGPAFSAIACLGNERPALPLSSFAEGIEAYFSVEGVETQDLSVFREVVEKVDPLMFAEDDPVWDVAIENRSLRRVEHVYIRAADPQLAQRTVLSGLQSFLGQFGKVVGTGAGALVVLLAGSKILLNPARKLPGDPNRNSGLFSGWGALASLLGIGGGSTGGRKKVFGLFSEPLEFGLMDILPFDMDGYTQSVFQALDDLVEKGSDSNILSSVFQAAANRVKWLVEAGDIETTMAQTLLRNLGRKATEVGAKFDVFGFSETNFAEISEYTMSGLPPFLSWLLDPIQTAEMITKVGVSGLKQLVTDLTDTGDITLPQESAALDIINMIAPEARELANLSEVQSHELLEDLDNYSELIVV